MNAPNNAIEIFPVFMQEPKREQISIQNIEQLKTIETLKQANLFVGRGYHPCPPSCEAVATVPTKRSNFQTVLLQET